MRKAIQSRIGSYARISIPTIRVAFALSFVLHAIALLGWPPEEKRMPFEDSRQGVQSGSLAVRLAPPPSPPPSAAPAPPPARVIRASPATAHSLRQPEAPQRAQSAAPVLALEPSLAETSTPPPTTTPRPPTSGDFASYVEARRRTRESASASPPVESEQERNNRIVAANLGLNRTPGFGADRRPGGGVFQIQRMGYEDAEFFFFGWNKDISRNGQQMIAVRRGANPSMEIAVVRRIITIIREHRSGDFLFESPRLGRELTLSARPADNAELEAFMLREFFPDFRSRE